MEKDVVMLYSGGADSRLMLNMAIELEKNIHCVLINYGQVHVEELQYAIKQLNELQISYQVITIDNYNVQSGLTGNTVKNLYDNVSEYNVPARNSIFLTMAAGIAENLGAKEVWIGCDMSDYYGKFPDCTQEYIGTMNKAFKIAFSYPIKIVAPLLGMEKDIIVRMLENAGINMKDIYSGYREFA